MFSRCRNIWYFRVWKCLKFWSPHILKRFYKPLYLWNMNVWTNFIHIYIPPNKAFYDILLSLKLMHPDWRTCYIQFFFSLKSINQCFFLVLFENFVHATANEHIQTCHLFIKYSTIPPDSTFFIRFQTGCHMAFFALGMGIIEV